MLCKDSQSPKATHSMSLFKRGYFSGKVRTKETRLVILFEKEGGRGGMCGQRNIAPGIPTRIVYDFIQI